MSFLNYKQTLFSASRTVDKVTLSGTKGIFCANIWIGRISDRKAAFSLHFQRFFHKSSAALFTKFVRQKCVFYKIGMFSTLKAVIQCAGQDGWRDDEFSPGAIISKNVKSGMVNNVL